MQCVVEPHSTGIGGDCFCFYAPGGNAKSLVSYNGSGRTPAAASVDWYLSRDIKTIERQSPHSVTVPGAVDAWCNLNNDHGVLPLSDILQQAIGYAEGGYPISARVSYDHAKQIELLKRDANAGSVFLNAGKTLQAGQMHWQPKLAQTLKKIAAHGRDAFYTGEVAQDIVSYLESLGGLHTLEDFAKASGEYVTPLSTNYRGCLLYTSPSPRDRG